MAWHIHQLVTGIHIFLAIIWVGGILFVGWGVYPAVKSLQFADQRQFLTSMMRKTHWLFTLAGAGVITTGVLLGTWLGPIHHWNDILNTYYGNIWVTAFFIAIMTLLWGIFTGYRQTMKMLSDKLLWEQAEQGNPKPLKNKMISITALEFIEVIGFMVMIVCMILLG
ncbi:hypothetical protein [Neobacillus mesonae]|uniref:hypothetical protein n=1 Tax=Neobacillus mesonae TaxID=1193713 RepID=UPI00203CF3F7|nr:hypothetical protein [Neobacillus mesonae]MCM3567622.1 hypothetical protein [Neobacillus mesonae]